VRSVNIADLKNNLSTYLNEVRQGEEILIKDRSLPIAKIVPLAAAEDEDAEEMALAATGKLRLRRHLIPKSFWSLPAPRISAKRAVAAVRAERNED
jgi:prevent-host-death family protein